MWNTALCLHSDSHLQARGKLGGSISGNHLKLDSQTFHDGWAKWIWDRGYSPYLSSGQPHFLGPCSPLPGFHRLPGSYFFRDKWGAPTLLGSNRLDFPQCYVVSDTPFLLWLGSCVVKSLQCFSTNNFWHKDMCVPQCNCKKHLRDN